MKRIWLSATCVFLLTACAEAPEPEDPAVGAQLAIDAATGAYAQSQEAGHAWQATRLRLESAQAALESGDYALAETEAQRALQTAEASLAQARTESEVLKAVIWNED